MLSILIIGVFTISAMIITKTALVNVHVAYSNFNQGARNLCESFSGGKCKQDNDRD